MNENRFNPEIGNQENSRCDQLIQIYLKVK
jgi:hypothetical protein